MDIKHLEYFLALAQREHIASTADLLNISPSALSKSITKLEQELGIGLFDRHGNYITLNDYGRTFFSYAAKTLEVYENGLLATRQTMYDTKGTIKIICHAYCDILRPVTADYSFLNPNVEITVSHHVSKGDAISEEVDFLLCYGQDSQTFWEKSGTWVSQELFQEPCYLLISKRYRTYPEDCEELSILDVKDDFFAVMWDGSFLTSDLAFKICQAAGFVPKVTVKTNNLIFKIGIAGEGRAVAIVPESCAQTALRLYADLRMFRIAEAAAQRPVYLLRKKKILASEAAQDFWNFVLEYYNLEPDERD